jgi:hypothetical protein
MIFFIINILNYNIKIKCEINKNEYFMIFFLIILLKKAFFRFLFFFFDTLKIIILYIKY